MIYEVPEKYSFAKSYLNFLGASGVIPTDFYVQELLLLTSFFESDFPKKETSYVLCSCFPHDFIELVHKPFGPKIDLCAADMLETQIDASKKPVILTQQRALTAFTNYQFDNFISSCVAEIFYICGSEPLQPRRMKINGSYIDGIGFMDWKKFRTSHLHMGMKRVKIENFVVEEW